MSINTKIRYAVFCLFIGVAAIYFTSAAAHDESHAPKSAKRLKNPLKPNEANLRAGREIYEQNCAGCHGLDGAAQTEVTAKMKVKPTDLTGPEVRKLTAGEIYWVTTHGIRKSKMPAYHELLALNERWQVTMYVQQLASGATADAGPNQREFAFNFRAVVGDKPFRCGESYGNIGVTKSTVTPTDFRFYVSNIRLVTNGGSEIPLALKPDGKWQQEDVALLDYEDGSGPCSNGTPELNTVVKGRAPVGLYHGLRFEVGVPFAKNHQDVAAAPSPLNLSQMFWVWNSGYKFARLEFNSTGLPNGYFLHLGSTGCAPRETAKTIPTQCDFPNRPDIRLDNFDARRDTVTFDLAALLEGANVDANQEKTARGCMSGPDDTDCAPLFHNLGLAFGGQPAPAQKVFRVSKTEAQASRGKSQVYAWDLPRGFPAPVAPADNPMSEAKVELGRYLFYDNNLSLNHSQSCASCHKQEMAFTDGLAQPVGSTGEIHPRSSMSLANMAYNPTLTWANHNLRSLENQALVPMFGETPVELGLAGKEGELLARLRAEPVYQKLFPRAFPAEKDPFTIANTTRGLASFVRSLISGNAPYDRYRYGDENAISPAAKRGELLFASERLECFHCHGGLNFSGPVVYQGKTLREAEFHNTGLYNLDGKGAYPADNTGLYELTQRPADMGRFKAPTLRNIALTAPYMHDGSVKTLDEVIDHYAAGGRAAAGNSGPSPLKSAFVKGFTLTRRERADLLAFLHSLTDEQFIRNPRFANPWTKRSDAK